MECSKNYSAPWQLTRDQFFFRFMIHYAIDNEEDAENIYREERVMYERPMFYKRLNCFEKYFL